MIAKQAGICLDSWDIGLTSHGLVGKQEYIWLYNHGLLYGIEGIFVASVGIII
jgi:hypothetical protein